MDQPLPAVVWRLRRFVARGRRIGRRFCCGAIGGGGSRGRQQRGQDQRKVAGQGCGLYGMATY